MSRAYLRCLVAVMVVALMSTGCNVDRAHIIEGGVWTTTYRISYSGDATLADSIPVVFAQVERSLSAFNDSSVVSVVNRSGSGKIIGDDLFVRVFECSRWVGAASGGAFDPTVGPLVDLWGFGRKGRDMAEPSAGAIDSVLCRVGIDECRIDEDHRIYKKSDKTSFDFSAIAKGLACDLVGEMFARNGCNDYMVEIGGEIALRGVNGRGRPWRIMIDAPVESDSGVVHSGMAVIEPGDGGVATSGNYRNFRDVASGRVGHTIDPSTGRPVVTDVLSATVTARSCMVADALATACMVMPPSAALAMLEQFEGVEGLIVSRSGDGYDMKHTPGFVMEVRSR